MDAFLIALAVVGGIIVIVLVLKFIRFLFTCFVVSRFLSFACIIVAMIFGGFVVSSADSGTLSLDAVAGSFITTVFAWMFFIGPVVFDVEWDGSFTLDFDTGDLTPNTVGGFFFNLFIAAVGAALLYFFLGDSFLPIFFVVPILLLIGNVIMIIKMRG